MMAERKIPHKWSEDPERMASVSANVYEELMAECIAIIKEGRVDEILHRNSCTLAAEALKCGITWYFFQNAAVDDVLDLWGLGAQSACNAYRVLGLGRKKRFFGRKKTDSEQGQVEIELDDVRRIVAALPPIWDQVHALRSGLVLALLSGRKKGFAIPDWLAVPGIST